MQQLIDLLNINNIYILLALMSINSIFFILLVILFIKQAKLKKKYNQFMNGSEVNIESLLMECIKKTGNVEKEHEKIQHSITQAKEQLQHCIQKVGMIRYNAVPGIGGELSFAMALLDEKDNGVVINGIYTRDGSYTYAKPITNGKSKHTLSEEEVQSVMQAKQLYHH